ncbi:MAG: TRAP transporter fused permease subunit [Rhodospirillaceae bacterium]|nr:TRAP transporter fused permease subunit [Rhodospirillaceae bacterium]MBT3886639.1 TRAP transporter fused permease subunit [Rhodospirillaceae bacterium]MBT4117768.1 TRAP transporter fused permease subunit [Rhodospirillaceae bacterium]MBT4674157.1 TRAP transporter fused permease subunit [Rhodospirillaceae bacterium]MBT4720862.1 TRAP transporter fused permease subunit [Rhodospirillaceae bacterium]
MRLADSLHSDEAARISPAAPPLRNFIIGLGVLLVIASIMRSLDLYRSVFALQLYDEQFLFPMIGVGLLLTFVHIPHNYGKRSGPVPWYDWLAGFSGLAACIYLSANYARLADEVVYQPFDAVFCAIIILFLCAEGLRRTVGMVLLSVLVFFILFGVAGEHIPGRLQGQMIEFGDLVTYLTFDTNALMGLPTKIVTTVVVAFLLMASLMQRSGAGDFLNDIAISLMGRYRGGAAKVAITASSLFGSISGSTVANVMSTGAITIPLMKRGGYSNTSAGAIEAVASTGGQLMPPVMGAVAFLMAEDLEVEYRVVAIAALVPSFLYYVGLFVQADLEAAKEGISRVDEELIPKFWTVVRQGWIFVIPFAILIVGLFWLNFEPEEAALDGCVALIALGLTFGYKGRKMSLKDIFWSIAETGVLVIDLVMIGAAVGMIIGILAKSGLGFALTLVLSQLGEGNFALLLVLAALVCIILGMGMPTIGVYVLVSALVAPSMIEVGVTPMAAHMYVLYFGMLSFITPPIAIAAFAAAKLAGSHPMATGWAATRFGWSAFVVPVLFVFSPSLLLDGAPLELVHDIGSAVAGVWLVSVAIVGYFRRLLTMYMRWVFAVTGFLLLIPATMFQGAGWTDLAGVAIGALIVGREFMVPKAPPAPAYQPGGGGE